MKYNKWKKNQNNIFHQLRMLINSFGYNIEKLPDINNLSFKLNNTKINERRKVCLELIKKYPNIPNFYLIMAETLNSLGDDEKFYYFNKYGLVRNEWLKEQKLNLLNIDFEKKLIFFHLENDFFVILALSRIKGIFFCLIFKIILGHISDSINIAIVGFQ